MKRRILFYLPVLGYGGVERVTQHLAQGLASQYDIIITGQGAEPDHLLAQTPLPPNVTLLPAPARRSAMQHRAIPAQALRLIGIIRRHRPHLLVSAWPRVHLTVGLAYRLLPSPQRPRWVLTEHNEIQGYLGKGWRAALKARLLQRWTHQADAHVAVSQKVAQLSGAIYPKARFRVIYNPAITPELERKAQEPITHPWFQGQTPVVLSVGRLEAMKDFPTLLQAFRLVLSQVPEARLVILGDGVLRRELEVLADKLGLQDKIWMPGFDPNPYRYMARATVFALSSAYGEASPMVLSEAMYLGKPVVLTRFATASEFVDPEQNGLLVEVGNPEALAQSLVRVLQDPALQRRLGIQARAKAQARFSVEQAVRNYALLFEELLEGA
ncbi:MAG: glycosyltransferase [Meiothermus sp.]|uniref:glycosyltransferase n=1 Tax=Meiothermus sp. TaxID=1955249 RepID=UPI0026052DB5|nr:glycosyltransferase [Meiothermus sp.]MCS7058379.1 glycosyltransferase [Meiothermus sp.]